MRVDAVRRGVHLGEHQVLGGAAQHGVRALLVLREDEELGAVQAADEDVAHLRGGFASREPVHVDAPDGEQLAQAGRFDGGRRGRIVGARGS